MYGLPDSAILGTGKRVKRSIVGRRKVEDEDNGEWSFLIYLWLEHKKRKARKQAKEQHRKDLERKHQVKFVPKKK